MTRLIARFYRSTEGLVVTLGAYVLAAYAIWLIHEPLFAAPPVLAIPAALIGLVFIGFGFYLWAEATQRILTAINDTFAGFINELMTP